MALFFEIQPLAEAVDAFDAVGKAALPKARIAFETFERERGKIGADQEQHETRRRMTGSEAFAATQELQTAAASAVRAATGDAEAHRAALAGIASRLDVEAIDAAAAFVPLPDPDSSPTARYMFTIANEAARAGYERRLPRMNGADLHAEVQRINRAAVSEHPHKGPALAQRAALADHLRERRGDEYAPAKSALIASRTRTANEWETLRTLVDRVQAAAQALDEVNEIATSIATLRRSPRLAYVQWRAKNAA